MEMKRHTGIICLETKRHSASFDYGFEWIKSNIEEICALEAVGGTRSICEVMLKNFAVF